MGIVLSAFLFKRTWLLCVELPSIPRSPIPQSPFQFLAGKSWPVVFSTGIGLGLAQAQCQFDFAHPELIKERLVKTRVAPSAASPATPVTPAEAVVVEAIRETISED